MSYTTARALEKYLDVPVFAGALQLFSGVPLTVSTICIPKGFQATLTQMQVKVLQGVINVADTGDITLKVYRNFTSDTPELVLEGLALTLPYDCEANLAKLDGPTTFAEDGNYSLVLEYVGTSTAIVSVEATFRLTSDITEDDSIDLGVLDGLRWVLPNTSYAEPLGFIFPLCPRTVQTSAVVDGSPGLRYRITVRIRGVVERIRYQGGYMVNPNVNVGGVNTNTANVYSLIVTDPPQTYHINAHDVLGQPYLILETQIIDYRFSFLVNAGATVTLFADSTDGAQLNPLVWGAVSIPEIYPGVYPGQYAQMDVLNVELIYDDV